MIQDFELYLTPAAGSACAGNTYGDRSVDQKAAADAAIGEGLDCFVQCKTDVDNLTSLTVDLVADDDGAGTNEVVVATRSLTLAQLNTNAVFFIGRVRPGAAEKKHYRIKYTEVGTDDSGTGRIAAWLNKATDYAPRNAGTSI